MSKELEILRDLKGVIKHKKIRGAWKNGVRKYAIELLESGIENARDHPESFGMLGFTERYFLNGEKDWERYSENGRSLTYGIDIANRLYSETELRRVRYGETQPIGGGTWLDVQARALRQAWLFLEKEYGSLLSGYGG